MAHLLLRHLAAHHLHTQRLRKRRERKLRPIRPSRRTELWYREQLQVIVAHLRAAGVAIANELRPSWPVVGDAVAPGITAALQRAAAKFGNIGGVAARLASLSARKSLEDVDGRLAAAIQQSVGVNVTPFLDAPEVAGPMAEATQANVELITSIPDEYLARVGEVVEESFRSGQRWEDMVDQISRVGDITENRAALIARDQTSKMTSSFNSVRQTGLGIEKYIWSTSHDERVRDSHRALDGKTFRWDDPPIVDGEPANPGMPINCRCLAEPVVDLDELSAEPDGTPLEEPGQEAEAA